MASFMTRASEKTRDILFTAAGTAVILQYFCRNTYYVPAVRYLAAFVFGCLMFGLMILAIMPAEIRPIRFDKALLIPWSIVTLFMLIAGITQSVDYLPDAMLMLVAFPVFYIVGADFARILRLLFHSVRISFVVFLLIDFLFFPIEQEKYSGFFNNVNNVSYYLALVFCCCLIELLAREKADLLFFIDLAFSGISAALVYYSNSRSGALGLLSAFLFTTVLVGIIDKRSFVKTFLRRFLPLFLSVAFFIPATIYLSQIPPMASRLFSQSEQEVQPGQEAPPSQEAQPGQEVPPSQVTPPDEGPQPDQEAPPSQQPAADPPSVSDVLEKVQDVNDLKFSVQDKTVNRFFTGRLSIWQSYIERLSLWGHPITERFSSYIEGKLLLNSTAHMTILEFAYRYGILAGLAYLAFNLIAGVKSIGYALRRPKDRYALAPIAVTIAFGAASVFSSTVSPFNYILTFYYYLVQCPLVKEGIDADKDRADG